MAENKLDESLVAKGAGDSAANMERDKERMLTFFQDIGLGCDLSERVASKAIERGIYSAEKLKLMIDRAAINLQEDLHMDQFDADLVIKGMNNPAPRSSLPSRPSQGARRPSNQPPNSRPTIQRTTQMNAPHGNNDQQQLLSGALLSTGFKLDLFGVLVDSAPLCLFACCCPCFPLAASMAALQDRDSTVGDHLCAPNMFQVRQQFRYRYVRPEAASTDPNEFFMEDCFVGWCCTPCGATQMVMEIALRSGNEPSCF